MLILAKLWPYIAIALLGAGLYFSVRHNGVLAARVDQVVDINKDNIAALATKDAAVARANGIAADAQAAADVLHKKYSGKRREIANAKPEDDGPLAPVLARELAGLPGPGGDQAAADTSAAARGKPEHVPGQP